MQPTLTFGKRAACSRRSWRRVPILFPLTQVLFLASACVSTDEAAAPPDAIHIGTVLPFSGERASSGVALESAMRLAVDTVNAGKGFSGQALWLDLGDSHSDDTLGTTNALALLDQGSMPFFIGTEEPKIAFQITDAIKAHQMVHLMPGLTSAQFHDPSAKAAWFRLSPVGQLPRLCPGQAHARRRDREGEPAHRSRRLQLDLRHHLHPRVHRQRRYSPADPDRRIAGRLDGRLVRHPRALLARRQRPDHIARRRCRNTAGVGGSRKAQPVVPRPHTEKPRAASQRSHGGAGRPPGHLGRPR